jgi:chemotaxis protein MotB
VSKKGRRHGGHEEEVENGERWLLTYADMITLLLALFIVLFAISTVNQKKFLALALGLKQTFNPNAGALPGNNGLLNNASLAPTAGAQLVKPNTPKLSLQSAGTTSSTTTAAVTANTAQANGNRMNPAVHSDLVAVENQINRALVARGLEHNVTTSIVTRGLIVQVLADKVFFATGSADLGTMGSEIVDTVAGVIRHDPYNIDVEGYTDNQPLAGGPYGSNTGLSAMRAVNVVQRLTTVDGLNPSRLAATGYGETHPAAPNDNPAHMALNRRIDLVILAPQEAQP